MSKLKLYITSVLDKMGIRAKLIVLFVIIKVLPLVLLAWIAVEGTYKIAEFFEQDSKRLSDGNAKIIKQTADSAIADAVTALDKKSQQELENMTLRLAKEIAAFLYSIDQDVRNLANGFEINEKNLENFLRTATKEVVEHPPYIYDEANKTWKPKISSAGIIKEQDSARLKDNEQEFSKYAMPKYQKQTMPLYKEITFIGLDGKEKIKVGSLTSGLNDISKRENTFAKAESYFPKLERLKQNDIYVSDVIGVYVGSQVIGKFTPESAQKAGIAFEPQKHGYAGKENPVGKRFEGIVRFASPVYKNGEKIGYVTVALNHRHIAEFTDTILPLINPYTDIKDASAGNYAFIWDYKGRNIAHPRDYFICGYDKDTGKPIPGWISKDLADKYAASGIKDLNDFLSTEPTFNAQSNAKKPNVAQIKQGKIPLDCRYLNFAPQCDGWMQLTEHGGYGSFIINWSGVTKLTTAATIPYYTGQYKDSKRGFGFVTIGANVDEFHAAANDAKIKVNNTLDIQAKSVAELVNDSKERMLLVVHTMIRDLSVTTFFLLIVIVLIAFWISNYIVSQIKELVGGANEFASGNFGYRIAAKSQDEIGQLANAYNSMAGSIKTLMDEQKNINDLLETRVKEEVEKSKQKDDLMARHARLAAMGEMIGNIAHQWRQPLNSLGLTIQELQFLKKLNKLDDNEVRRVIQESMLHIEYMSKTIDDFRNFFSPNKNSEVFNLAKVANDAIEMLSMSMINADISVKTIFDTALDVNGYPNEFKQVLLVLLANSKDAIVSHDIRDGEITVSIYEKDNFDIVNIADNGGGIAIDIIDKIFDPYFTTKHKAQGTGIGLYMAKMIIENNMSGMLKAENIDNGALFTIMLPKL